MIRVDESTVAVATPTGRVLVHLPTPTPAPSLDPCGDGAGLAYHVDLGTTWLTRDDQQVRVDRADIPALVAWLLVAEDRLSDAL